MKILKRKARKFLKQFAIDIPAILVILGIGMLMFMAFIGAL